MMKKSSGFTMIELMITITILGTLTLLTAQSIQQAVKAKVKLQDQIDDVSRMRDALRLLERDINLAYHYRDLEKEIDQLVKKKPANQQQ
ncbi:prepilin-type N-terminal cleavage/methylation domain-containing protein, partial [Bdellovibrio sp.]